MVVSHKKITEAFTQKSVNGRIPSQIIITVTSFTVTSTTVFQTEFVHILQSISAMHKL